MKEISNIKKTTSLLNGTVLAKAAMNKLLLKKDDTKSQVRKKTRSQQQHKWVLNTIIAVARNNTTIVDNFKDGNLFKIDDFSYISASPVTIQKVKKAIKNLQKIFEDIDHDVIAVNIVEISEGMEYLLKCELEGEYLSWVIKDLGPWKVFLDDYWKYYGLTRDGTILTPDIMKLLINDSFKVYTEQTHELLNKKEISMVVSKDHDNYIPF